MYSQWADTVKNHLLKEEAYLELLQQPGTTPHEIFEDTLKSEKEMLKCYKTDFKKLVKTNCIKFPSDVPFDVFDLAVSKFEFFEQLNDAAKMLLHEYY